ncbi:MAG: electron transfer flavoprotein subunit alpha/FixB family protein [Candidatus Marinimicrobia bacterium]|nr:electron transfer flavoprotein subunit alpha/FixB family protein [Candidatus Neomarinimicrobiota bacterium]
MKTIVYIEKNPVTGKCRFVSLELAYKAYTMMQEFNGEVLGVFVGDHLPEDADKLFHYGLDKLIYFTNENLKNLQSLAYKNIIEQIIRQEEPDIVLFGATHNGRDIAPLIASSLKTGLTADCTQLFIDDLEYKDEYKGKCLYQVRPAFGGNILATIITPDNRPMMATVREGVMSLPDTKLDKKGVMQEANIDFSMEWVRSEFLSVVPKKSTVNFGSKNIIVAGGAGVGSKENFDMLHKLAALLDAEVGASRAAVDFGYAEKARQIGQTGSVVRPKIYIAAGISGQIQHRAGMEESMKIIAINTDPNAPIFNISHKGIVGDVKDVIPKMIQMLREEE